LLEAAGIDPAALDDVDARIGHEEYNRLLVAAMNITGDDALGLHMGERSSMLDFDVFDRQFLDCQQHPRHVEVYLAMKALAERKLTRITRQGALAQRLREFLAAQPPPAYADMETAARWFGISVRSLRRKLELEHASFTGVLAEARATVAKRMLEDPDRSIGETAHALGFSEASAFHRAFKRWTGMTPTAYRSQL